LSLSKIKINFGRYRGTNFIDFGRIKSCLHQCIRTKDKNIGNSTLSKYKELPSNLKIISDGNPIYNVAVQYWTEHGMPFKLYQVIGLTNKDEVSKEYRSQKQIIERHNRTLKYYYRPKGGFTSLNNANSYMILFSTCFNFLRPHSALKYKVPVEIPEIQNLPNMPAKWIELINLSYQYFKTSN